MSTIGRLTPRSPLPVRRAALRQAASSRRPSSRLTWAVNPSSRLARVVSASRRGTGFTFRGGWNSGSRSNRAGHPLDGFPQAQQRSLGPARDVVDRVVRIALHRQHVGPGDVADVDEVHRRRPVAVDLRPPALLGAVQPADEDLGVRPGQVHPRAVHVEVAQADAGQAVHVVEVLAIPSSNSLAAPYSVRLPYG